MKKTRETYSGQALAIVMLVLVVSALIGLSIYSRTRKDKALSLEERASAEALEVSDIILNSLTEFSTDQMIKGLKDVLYDDPAEELDLVNGVELRENEEEEQITKLFQKLGLDEVLGVESLSKLMGPLCPIESSTNEYKLTFKEADPDMSYSVLPGFSWAYSTRKIHLQDGQDCSLEIFPKPSGYEGAGFVLSKIYCTYDEKGRAEKCKEYEYDTDDDDIRSYCFGEDECNNEGFEDLENWIVYNPREQRGVSILLDKIDTNIPETQVGDENQGDDISDSDGEDGDTNNNDGRGPQVPRDPGYNLPGVPSEPGEVEGIYTLPGLLDTWRTSIQPSEIRLQAVGGTVNVSFKLNGCSAGDKFYLLRVTANCMGTYRGKEIIIPEEKWHHSLFDYVLFNAKGNL